MYTVEIVVRNAIVGDSRSLQWQLDPANFGTPNWDKTFLPVQAAVQDLQLSEVRKIVDVPLL